MNETAQAPAGAPAQPERRIGKYELIHELGRGATSVVYKAYDPFQNREVALKAVNPEALGDDEYGRRCRKLFVTEASLAGKLSHPHIVAIYDAVAGPELSYIVMEYIDGSTLERYAHVDQRLPLPRVLEIIYKCARALDFAAREGLIHRDIKPANILLAGEVDIKISDFGAALNTSSESTQITGIGSPAYMSPEQVREQPLTCQTDIFSLGVVFYQLLTGRLPFLGTNNYSIIYQIINVEPAPPSRLRSEVPPAIDAIVMRMLSKSTLERYQTWSELAGDLVDAIGGTRTRGSEAVPEAEKFDTLRRLAFFSAFRDVDLWEVLRLARWQPVASGAVVIQEGDIGSSFFIIAEGEVEVRKQQRPLNRLGAGECFGEMAYLGKQKFQRSASVVAISDATLIEIRAETLPRASELCRHHFNGAFLELLVDRLSAANLRLSEMLTESRISVF
jgi:predicted Ser/Thr protein kinase